MTIGSPPVKNYRFILASTSPRRQELLGTLGIPVTVVSPSAVTEVDETPLPQESPDRLVQRLSRLKAKAVAENFALIASQINLNQTKQIFVIAADTVVVLDSRILGKPETSDQATQMLKWLRQRGHDVYSGLTVIHLSRNPIIDRTSPNGYTTEHIVTRLHRSKVWMRAYTDSEIAVYVAGGSPLDKAGAYGIQDQRFAPVERLEGCFASVMGLPLGELASALELTGFPLREVAGACQKHIEAPCCQKPAL